jgi:hypothetical protein
LREAERDAVPGTIRWLAIGGLAGALAVPAQTVKQERYHWKNVQIVGGGFVDGVIFHPTVPGVR